MHAYQPERLIGKEPRNWPFMAFISENRYLCAGAALSVVVMSSIFVNAAYFQPGKHPSPLFATRNLDTIQSAGVKKAEPEIASATKQSVAVKSTADGDLMREVQSALAVRGYYTGKLDGIYGSRTKKAILSFQADHSMKQTGQASLRLLTQVLMSASAKPSEVPVPKEQIAQKPVKVKTVRVKAAAQIEVVQQDGLVARIQAGLRNYGYDDLKVDGRMGQQTATAIQRFQLDYGMKITGEPSQQLLEKLSEIGAYQSG